MASSSSNGGRKRLPEWLKVRLPTDAGAHKEVVRALRQGGLNTVCTGARCPNLAECWACGTATLMILGKECSRNCRFCAVPTNSSPSPPEENEPAHVGRMVARLGLKYVVVTSVTRDDLPDQGAGHFVSTVHAINKEAPATRVELLIPDLGARAELVEQVSLSGADVVGHNLETVRRLTPLVRDGRASYQRSLDVLRMSAGHGVAVKTALLLGLGETAAEVMESLAEAYEVGVRHAALGQYLAPSAKHVPVERYWEPSEFVELEEAARNMGYHSVAAGPLVRSSYRAEEFAGKATR